MTIPIQINGKLRSKAEVESGLSDEALKKIALSDEKVQKWLEGKPPKKVIVVPNRLVNIIV